MQTIRFVPVLTAAAGALTLTALTALSTVRAQPPDPASPPLPSPSSPTPFPAPADRPDDTGVGNGGGRTLADLTPEERERVRAARRAVAKDPAVRQARRAWVQAEREAMLRQDPTLGPVLDKLGPRFGDGGGGRRGERDFGGDDAFGPGRSGGGGARRAMLTPEERARLASAQRAARQDPAVLAARQNLQAATTPEARRAARRTMRAALRAAMLRADAGVGAILDKVGRGGNGGPGA